MTDECLKILQGPLHKTVSCYHAFSFVHSLSISISRVVSRSHSFAFSLACAITLSLLHVRARSLSHTCTSTLSLSLCQKGYFSHNATSPCIPCPQGTFGVELNSSSCTQCPPGTYSNKTAVLDIAGCTSCPGEHMTSKAGSSGACSCRCKPGYEATGTCTACVRGKYLANESFPGCLPCEVGKFTSVSAATHCTSCPLGTFQSSTAASSCDGCGLGNLAIKSEGTYTCGPATLSISQTLDSELESEDDIVIERNVVITCQGCKIRARGKILAHGTIRCTSALCPIELEGGEIEVGKFGNIRGGDVIVIGEKITVQGTISTTGQGYAEHAGSGKGSRPLAASSSSTSYWRVAGSGAGHGGDGADGCYQYSSSYGNKPSGTLGLHISMRLGRVLQLMGLEMRCGGKLDFTVAR